jgi:hypothetical protein
MNEKHILRNKEIQIMKDLGESLGIERKHYIRWILEKDKKKKKMRAVVIHAMIGIYTRIYEKLVKWQITTNLIFQILIDFICSSRTG